MDEEITPHEFEEDDLGWWNYMRGLCVICDRPVEDPIHTTDD